jgi:hypothetical protein
MTLRRYYISSPLLLMALVVGCDRADPVAPSAVRAASAAGSGTAPTAPSGTHVIAVSESQIDVSWQDNSTNESGFELYRSTTGPSGVYTLRASTGVDVGFYSDVGLTASTQYCYHVRAFRTAGRKTSYSPFSVIACATTLAPPPPPGPPSAPLNVDAVALPPIQVWWSDNSTNDDGFRIERSTDGGVSWANAGTTAYSIFTDEEYSDELQVCYRVFAFNAFGDSPPSNTDCTLPPAGPSDLAMIEDDLTWTDNSSVESGYELWFMDVNGGPAYEGLAATFPANTTSIPGLGPCNPSWCWGWVVMAVTSDGGRSDWASVVTRSPE